MMRNGTTQHGTSGDPSPQTGEDFRQPRDVQAARWRSLGPFCCAVLFLLATFVPQLLAQSQFVIQSITPSFIGAGANGATLVLNGSLAELSSYGYQVCFYNGSSTSTPITPSFVNNVASIAVPASSIQSVPAANFTGANGYSVAAQVYIASQGATDCDGTSDSTLTNSFSEPISEPLLETYLGPTNVPQTNSATNLQAPPVNIAISGSSFTAATTVTLGSFGAVTPKLISPSAISFAVPAALSSSAVGTTASVTVCNGTTYCSGAASTLTLTVTALVPSAGTLTITPTPTTATGTTTLTAQFKRDPANGTTLPGPGVPSGVVTFKAGGNTVGTAPLVLDTTAIFEPVTTTTTIPATITPVITPPAGVYVGSQTVTITDTTPGAVIYYTTDGSSPTTASTIYAAPFSISASGTISAVALASGFRTSAVASNAYTVRLLPPHQLAFVTQPTTTATGVTITPAVTVAVQDVNGNTIANSTLPVSIQLYSNPNDGTLLGTVTVDAINGIATFPDLSIVTIANGYSLTASSANLIPAISSNFNITPYPISVKLFAPLIGVTSTLPGSFTLSHPAPAGAVTTVSLASSDTTLVSVTPATVVVPVGGTTGTFTYTGVQPTSTVPPANNNLGVATITASAPNYLAGSASTTETYSLVSLSTIPAVAPAQVIDLATSLATIAPAGGITIYFSSSDPTIATITQSVFVPAGQRTAAANPQITGVKIGTANIVATAQGYAPAYRTVNVTVTASFNPGSISVPLATSNVPTLNITAPAQPGGITFTLTSDTPANVTVPASVTIPAGQTSVVVPVTGVANTSNYVTLRANSPGVAEADLNVYVNATLTMYPRTTGAKLVDYSYVNIPTTSPTPITVTITVADTSIATISATSTAIGQKTLTFPNVTNPQNLVFYVQGQAVGTTTLTSSAPGYTSGSGTLTIDGAGFVFNGYYLGGQSTTTLSTPTSYVVYPAVVDSSGAYVMTSTIAPGVGTITLPLLSSNPAIGTLQNTPPANGTPQNTLTFNPGDTQQYAVFTPLAAGTTTLSLGAAPTGFSTPTTYKSFVETVTAPQLSVNSVTNGVNLQSQMNVSLPVTAPNPVSVTITSSNPAVTLLSVAGTATGSASITVPNVSNSFNFFVQGVTVGTSTITATATGYASATGTNAGTATVYPTGFTINPYDGTTYSTTTFSNPNTGFQIVPAILYPTGVSNAGNFNNFGTLSPGIASVSVPLSSSNTAVGTVSPASLTFVAGDTGHYFTFTPTGAGITNFGISGTPAGYTTGTNYQTVAATVTAPQLSINNVTSGVNMQTNTYLNMPVTPPSPVTVTITSSNPAVALLSTTGTAVGSTSLTVMNVSTGLNIYVQGLTVGTTVLTATAPGFASATGTYAGTITVYPSGFVFYYGVPINTTTFSSPTSFPVYPSILYPSGSGNAGVPYQLSTVSPGAGPFTVPITSSDTVVGTVATGALVFKGLDTSESTTFQPTSAGMTTIAIGTPAGFTSTTAGYNTFVATVTAPALQMGNVITGYGLESTTSVYLPVSPPNPITVTVTSNGPAIATISKDGTVVGGTTLTFTNVTSSGNLPAIYVQGQAPASGTASTNSVATTLTASAPGYTNAVATATVYPSGFATNFDQSFTRTVADGPGNITVYPWALNPGVLTLYTNLTLSPATPANVTVTSSNTGVGTISNAPLVFAPGDTQHYFTFTPVATGTSTITIGNPNPAVFTNPSQGQTATATIQ
jgi:hypothetical protein